MINQNKYSILFQYQFRFRKGNSTSQAIIELTDTLRKAIDSNLYLYASGVFLDFSKAFDTENHEILLKEFEVWDIRGSKWFSRY